VTDLAAEGSDERSLEEEEPSSRDVDLHERAPFREGRPLELCPHGRLTAQGEDCRICD
jgi:hypothetical protein